MNAEDVRQLVYYFLSDNELSVDDIAEQLDIPVNRIIEFVYGSKYLDESIAESLQLFLNQYYKKRDEARNATLGKVLLEDGDESPYTTNIDLK